MTGTAAEAGRRIVARSAISASFGKQIEWCRALQAPFTASILSILADELEADRPPAGMIADWPGDPVADALPLRLAGALHALVLSGTAPALAACYPPEAMPGTHRLRSALRETLDMHHLEIGRRIASPPQTNEVGRSAVLLGGFLRIADRVRRPLRLLEIGASAGLNMIWDRFRYRIAGQDWGDPNSPVHLVPDWSGPPPPMTAPVRVVERRGCDLSPLALEDTGHRLALRGFVWPEQCARLERMEAAIGLALREGIAVERADASVWVPDRLRRTVPGRATVLYHSIMWQYLPDTVARTISAALDEAASRATDAAPLAWLRFEPPTARDRPELRLTCWPGGTEDHLATAHPHGSSIEWHSS